MTRRPEVILHLVVDRLRSDDSVWTGYVGQLAQVVSIPRRLVSRAIARLLDEGRIRRLRRGNTGRPSEFRLLDIKSMVYFGRGPWTDDLTLDVMLRRAAGESTPAIARSLGLSKNAVVGKLDRIRKSADRVAT